MGAIRNSACYVVRSKPRAEAFAAANRRRKAIETFLPRLKQPFSRDAAHAVEPLFPGYLFARLSLETQFRIASWTPGVAHLLSGPDGAPAALDDVVVAALRERASGGDVVEARPAFRAGDPVDIRTGPFAGLLATMPGPARAPAGSRSCSKFSSDEPGWIYPRPPLRRLKDPPAEPGGLPCWSRTDFTSTGSWLWHNTGRSPAKKLPFSRDGRSHVQ
ncbi:MAG: hypothetical protein FJ148_08220 [Deltaproteobacteria bacterium]|nr:hypothetical protein [Deltaproteobacteria bacterium]